MNETNRQPLKVDRKRLGQGGDILASASADIIVTTYSSAPRIRQPFTEDGRLYVTTSIVTGTGATAYELTPCEEGEPDQRVANDQFAGRVVEHDDKFYRIQSPPIQISAAEEPAEAEAEAAVSPEAATTPEPIVSEPAQPITVASTTTPPPLTVVEAPVPEVKTDSDNPAPTITAEEPAEEIDAEAAAPEAAPAQATPPAATAQPQSQGSPKKVYKEELPERSYAVDGIELKLTVKAFTSSGQMLGRDIRVTTQIYDHPPVIERFQELECGGVSGAIALALAKVTDSLPELEAAYNEERAESVRQMAARREKELADKIRQSSKTKAKPTSSTAVKQAGQEQKPQASSSTAPASQDQPNNQPASTESAATDGDAASADEETSESFENLPVFDDTRPSAQNTTAAPPPPAATTTTSTKRTRKSPDNQAALF